MKLTSMRGDGLKIDFDIPRATSLAGTSTPIGKPTGGVDILAGLVSRKEELQQE